VVGEFKKTYLSPNDASKRVVWVLAVPVPVRVRVGVGVGAARGVRGVGCRSNKKNVK
jgi:hypothetical protein